jgi:phosphocarrier protein
MTVKEITVKNEKGLCTEAASYFIQRANEYVSSVWVEQDERRVNAKSLLGVLYMGIVRGARIKLIAHGVDEKEAVEGLAEILETTGED